MQLSTWLIHLFLAFSLVEETNNGELLSLDLQTSDSEFYIMKVFEF